MPLVSRVRATCTGVAGAPYYLNFYFSVPGVGAQLEATSVRNLLAAGAGLQVPAITTRVEPVVVALDSVTGQPQGAEAVDPGDPIQGSGGSSPLPLQTQLGVNLKSGSFQNGRQIQGHFSLPGINEEINETGVGPNTTLAAYGAFRDALQATANNEQLGWCVWSRKTGVLANVLTARINPRWFTLRSRLS